MNYAVSIHIDFVKNVLQSKRMTHHFDFDFVVVYAILYAGQSFPHGRANRIHFSHVWNGRHISTNILFFVAVYTKAEKLVYSSARR